MGMMPARRGLNGTLWLGALQDFAAADGDKCTDLLLAANLIRI
jgi:hypothetical protein